MGSGELRTCAFSAIRQASRAVNQLYELALAPAGLKPSQFMMLNVIAEVGEIAQCEFARRYSISVETLSRRFAALKRKGFVFARIGAHSERIYRLSEKGQAALEQAQPFWQNAQMRLNVALGGTEWSAFLLTCDKVVRAAHEAEEIRLRNGHPPLALRTVAEEDDDWQRSAA
jgi:DNA-binding MarR family transcriptional regulator